MAGEIGEGGGWGRDRGGHTVLGRMSMLFVNVTTERSFSISDQHVSRYLLVWLEAAGSYN